LSLETLYPEKPPKITTGARGFYSCRLRVDFLFNHKVEEKEREEINGTFTRMGNI
jgi:hypothetical protein